MTSKPIDNAGYFPIKEDVFHIENSFYLRSDPYRIGKLIGQYELYKKIVNLPGAVVECGVFKGVSLIRWATFRHMIETTESRKIIGFDAFGSFPSEGLSRIDDLEFAATHDNESGGAAISVKTLRQFLDQKGFTNYELVPGNLLQTLESYFSSNEFEKIALLHLDVDVHAPTDYALNYLYDRVVSGGLILIDDYGTVSGATAAVDDFVSKKNLKILKSKYYKIPAYIIKP